jgi:broad specificity phosphatase PhoE
MLILLRHGQTVTNAEGRLLGRADPELTDLGLAQARAAAAAIGDVGRVVTSPLQRARRTAECLGVPVEVDDRWIELDYGDYDGRAFHEVPSDVWARWRDDPHFVPPGGESLSALGARVREACHELALGAADSDVVVVSHVSPIKAAVAWALGVDDGIAWRMFLDVAAVTRIGLGPRGPSLRSFNERSHLAALG